MTNRVNESLQNRAKDNKIVQEACKTNAKLNDLAMQMAMDDDIESSIIMANFARSFSVAFLKKSSHIVTHPWEYTKEVIGGITDTIVSLAAEHIKLQTMQDAFMVCAEGAEALVAQYIEDCAGSHQPGNACRR